MSCLRTFIKIWRYKRAETYAVCLNDVDPITQDAIADIAVPFVVVLNEARQYVVLDAIATAQYILASGKTVNLVTQHELTTPELRRLDRLTAGKCESVVENLARARADALERHDRQHICQALEVEPAMCMSALFDAPFALRPHVIMRLLPTVVRQYDETMHDYFVVDAAAATEFHSDNMSRLRAMDVSTGDAVIHQTVLALMQSSLTFFHVDEETDEDDEDEEDTDDDVVFVSSTSSAKRQRVD